VTQDREHARWSAAFAGAEYFYGLDAGPVARRAVRYHRPLRCGGSTPVALDLGCGEGQDLAYLAECGYDATGVDFVENAIGKAQNLLARRGLTARAEYSDLRQWRAKQTYELVLACNSLQFLGQDAPVILERVRDAVAPDGVLALSLFGCENGEAVQESVYFSSLENLLSRFEHLGANRRWQMLETANLWQWNRSTNAPQPFVTLIAQRLR
jgi:trans-aconitate methyltransferase